MQDHVPEAISKFNSYENAFFTKIKGYFFFSNSFLVQNYSTNPIFIKSIFLFLLNLVLLRGVAYCKGSSSCCHWTYSHCRALPYSRSPLLFHSSLLILLNFIFPFSLIICRQSLMYVFLLCLVLSTFF